MKFDITSLVLGMTSGLVSFLSFYQLTHSSELLGLWILPGVWFGIFLVAFLKFFKNLKASWSRVCTGVLFSLSGYFSAVHVAIYLGKSIDSLFLALIVSGVVGASILLIGVHMFLFKLDKNQFIRLILAGGLLGLSWYVIPEGLFFPVESYGPGAEKFLSLYVFWQGGMMMLLGSTRVT